MTALDLAGDHCRVDTRPGRTRGSSSSPSEEETARPRSRLETTRPSRWRRRCVGSSSKLLDERKIPHPRRSRQRAKMAHPRPRPSRNRSSRRSPASSVTKRRSNAPVVVSPDGRRILSGSDDHTLILWNRETAQPIRRLKGHTARVIAVAISPDGRRALSGGDDSIVRLWELDSGETIRTLQGHTECVLSVAFSPDGRLGYSTSGGVDQGGWQNGADSAVRVWKLETGEEVRKLEGLGDSSGAWPSRPTAVASSRAGTLRRRPSSGMRRPGLKSAAFANTTSPSSASPSSPTAVVPFLAATMG